MPIKLVNGKGGLASDKVLAELRKQHGEQVATKGGKYKPVVRIPTGVFPLDLATGGGFPRSRVGILYGPESSGKSLNLYKLMLSVQRMGETAVLIDTEHAWEGDWGKLIGLDLSKLIIVQPDNAEQAVDAVEAFLYAKDVGIVGLDSISALTTENEIISGAEKMIVAGSAMIVTKMIRKVGVALSVESRKENHFPAFVVVSQIRQEIGKMFGDPEKTSGGNALRFASSLTLRLYGKNMVVETVNKDKPAFKHVSGIVKKYRCPIVGTAFEYDQCIVPHDGMTVGEVKAWNTVSSYLKAQGHMAKVEKGGWSLFGEKWGTIDQIKEAYVSDKKFAMKCELTVASSAIVINSPPSPEKIDKDTGEILET